MADEAAHRAEARANRDLAEHLLAARPDDPVYLRWAVTARFSAGLHAITAYLVARGVTVGNHDDRSTALPIRGTAFLTMSSGHTRR